MKREDLLPNDWLEQWGTRPMKASELKLLDIEDRDDYEYYVCENWLKFLLNFKTFDEIQRELENNISVEFEIDVATKQKQSIKKYKAPVVVRNLEKGQRVDVRSTIHSGMARYSMVTFEKRIKRTSSRKINPFVGWQDRNRAQEKLYGLLSTQSDAERVFINFVACSKISSMTKKNAVIWFIDLDFDMFKAQKKNFYPIISHNLALAYTRFINRTLEQANAQVSVDIAGIEHMHNLI